VTPVVPADGVWLAPAKLNLMLRVLGRRPDGYHRLQTVFQFIDRCDRIRIRTRPDGRITRGRGAVSVAAEDDLVVRAARLLQRATACRLGADIDVDKLLPMGGGLGGGSSDAATTLVALNRLWGLELDEDALAALGLELGADVPVFVRGRAGWAEGVGEHLTPVVLPEPWFIVLRPPCHISTAAVFGDPDLTRDSSPLTISGFLEGDARNDCLPVVARRFPIVNEALDWLSRRGAARLTGTGSCVFAAFAERSAAESVRAEAPPQWSAFVARGLNRSPLFAAIGATD
jgi:4-diphosphocytidyl-2-C-methyl-D-erythritol kinase